jgi:hypothetical protein
MTRLPPNDCNNHWDVAELLVHAVGYCMHRKLSHVPDFFFKIYLGGFTIAASTISLRPAYHNGYTK